MQVTNYIGFNNQVCQCEFVSGTVNGVEVLVLKQTANSKTSITNMIENIVSGLLASDLNDIDATNLRVFEFYPPGIAPQVSWQEVTFGGVARRSPRKTILQRLVEFVRPTEQPFVVWNPAWSGVPTGLQIQLAGLDPALV